MVKITLFSLSAFIFFVIDHKLIPVFTSKILNLTSSILHLTENGYLRAK